MPLVRLMEQHFALAQNYVFVFRRTDYIGLVGIYEFPEIVRFRFRTEILVEFEIMNSHYFFDFHYLFEFVSVILLHGKSISYIIRFVEYIILPFFDTVRRCKAEKKSVY